MKRIKNLTLGVVGAAILSLGLFSCSNDDATTANNTTEQTTMAAKGFGDIKIVPGVPEFGMVSPYIGDCMPGKSFCFSSSVPDTKPIFGIGRLDNTTVRLTMSMETYKANQEYLSGGIFKVTEDFSLNQELSKELGFDKEVIIPQQRVNVVQEDSDMFYIDLSVKHNYDAEVIMKDFMLYKATIEFPRVKSSIENEKRTAKSFALVPYSDLINPTYIYDGDEYNDLGLVNDIEAGDGIYTSNALYEAEEIAFDYKKLNINVSSEFTALDLLKEDFQNKTLSEKKPKPSRGGNLRKWLFDTAVGYLMGCVTYTTQGESLLGFPCKTGCLEIDC